MLTYNAKVYLSNGRMEKCIIHSMEELTLEKIAQMVKQFFSNISNIQCAI